jgi:acetylornithine deacetylase/succinyl-diaminopimelate desuccinylase-like protein
MLPGSKAGDVQAALARVVADSGVSIAPIADSKPSDPSPLTGEILGPVERLTQELWPGVPVVPTMSTGATDSLYLRNAGIPAYGVSGLFQDIDDTRSHGRDERIGVKEFYDGLEFLYRLVKALSSPAGR